METESVDVTVEVTVNVGGQPRTVRASALTDANPYQVASGLLQGLQGDTVSWLTDQRFEWNRTYR